MDEFYAFLFAGLLTFFLLVLFFGINQQPGIVSEYSVPTETGGPSKNVTQIEPSNYTFKEIYLGDFDVYTYLTNESKLLVKKVELKNGFFFGNKREKLRFSFPELPNAQNISLYFYVLDTNELGKINISINGNPLYYDKVIKGEYELDVPKDLLKNKGNILSMEADSSGFIFWQPNYCLISNLSLTWKKKNQKVISAKFYIYPNRYQNLYEARLIFLVKENSSEPLYIHLNGNPIFSEIAGEEIYFLTLDKSNLFPGDNIIEFSTFGSYQIRDAKIDYTYLES